MSKSIRPSDYILERMKEEFFVFGDLLYWKKEERPAGSKANSNHGNTYYYRTKFLRRLYYNHCIIWFLRNGEWPDKEINHINGHGWCNEAYNLELVSRSENMKRKPGWSKTGFKHVKKMPDKYKYSKPYTARFWITVPERKYVSVPGYFATPEEASENCNNFIKANNYHIPPHSVLFSEPVPKR